jgi:hypothetical protein
VDSGDDVDPPDTPVTDESSKTQLAIPSAGTASLSLADLIDRLSAQRTELDEYFARDLAMALHAQTAHIRIPAVDAMGLLDVVATFSLDGRVTLIVTGNMPDLPGDVTIRWKERHFPHVPVVLSAAPDEEGSYAFATLDYSVKDREGLLLAASGPLPAGQRAIVRALATVGGETTLRVAALGMSVTIDPTAFEWDPVPQK